MFGSRIRAIEKSVGYLESERVYKSEVTWLRNDVEALRRDIDALMAYLKVTRVEHPPRFEVAQKGGPEKGSS